MTSQHDPRRTGAEPLTAVNGHNQSPHARGPTTTTTTSTRAHEPPAFLVPDPSPSSSRPGKSSSARPSLTPAKSAGPTITTTTSRGGLSLRLTRTHSRKELYDADAASVYGEFGAYGHASEEGQLYRSPSSATGEAGAASGPGGGKTRPTASSRGRSRSKSTKHETMLERIGDLEKEDVEMGAHEARELDEVRRGGTGENEWRREREAHAKSGGEVDLEKQASAAVAPASQQHDRQSGSTPSTPGNESGLVSTRSRDSGGAAGGGGGDGGGDDDGKSSSSSSDANLVTWDSPDSTENPRNWAERRRWFVVLLVSSYTLLSPLASSMIAPALPLLSEQFNVTSSVERVLMLSTFVLAYAMGPLFLAPASEMYGRRLVLQSANLFFIAFNIGCGASQTSAQMTVLRFFAGLGGSAPLAAGGGTIADLFEPADRGTAMAVYSLAPLLGPAIGPIAGGWIIQTTQQWRLIFWASSGFAGLTAIVGFILLPETYAPRILELKAKRLRKQTGNDKLHTIFETDESVASRIAHNLVRPFVLLTTQPIIQVFSIAMMVLYGVMYLLLTEFPTVYEGIYGQRPGIASLHYIALAIGFTLGGQVGGRLVDRIYRRLRDRNGGQGQPEFKLPLLMVTSFLVPIGLLIYGWTAEYRKHWIAPDIGAAIFATGLMGSFVVIQGYLVDVMPLYAASTLAAAVFLRSLGGFALPLVAPTLYSRLGQGWGNSILALVAALIGIPSPFVLSRYGPYLRSKSAYASKQKAGNALS